MSKKADLSWNVDGLVHSFNYYRYEAPTAIENLPAPLVSDISSNNYTDTTVEDDKQYYWRIGAVRAGNEKISDESAFSTMNNLKHWILSNSTIGDAWLARDANQATLEIPSLTGRESRMLCTGSLPTLVDSKYLNCIDSLYKLDNSDVSRWKFLHKRNEPKFICVAYKIDTIESNYYPIFTTGEVSSSLNTAFALAADHRAATDVNSFSLFQCSEVSSSGNYTSAYNTQNGASVRGVDVLLCITQSQSISNNIPEAIVNNTVRVMDTSFRENTVSDKNPASVLCMLGTPSKGVTFKGRFYGALVVNTTPTTEDREQILNYFTQLMT